MNDVFATPNYSPEIHGPIPAGTRRITFPPQGRICGHKPDNETCDLHSTLLFRGIGKKTALTH